MLVFKLCKWNLENTNSIIAFYEISFGICATLESRVISKWIQK